MKKIVVGGAIVIAIVIAVVMSRTGEEPNEATTNDGRRAELHEGETLRATGDGERAVEPTDETAGADREPGTPPENATRANASEEAGDPRRPDTWWDSYLKIKLRHVDRQDPDAWDAYLLLKAKGNGPKKAPGVLKKNISWFETLAPGATLR